VGPEVFNREIREIGSGQNGSNVFLKWQTAEAVGEPAGRPFPGAEAINGYFRLSLRDQGGRTLKRELRTLRVSQPRKFSARNGVRDLPDVGGIPLGRSGRRGAVATIRLYLRDQGGRTLKRELRTLRVLQPRKFSARNGVRALPYEEFAAVIDRRYRENGSQRKARPFRLVASAPCQEAYVGD
jgi:hypothetical protein